MWIGTFNNGVLGYKCLGLRCAVRVGYKISYVVILYFIRPIGIQVMEGYSIVVLNGSWGYLFAFSRHNNCLIFIIVAASTKIAIKWLIICLAIITSIHNFIIVHLLEFDVRVCSQVCKWILLVSHPVR